MRTLALLCHFCAVSILIAQQNKPSPHVEGNCNGTASGENITVTVKCGDGVSEQDAKKLADQYSEILKRIRQENLKFDDVINRLRNIQGDVTKLSATVKSRHLTKAQIEALKTLRSDPSINLENLDFEYYNSDPEAARYAGEYIDALQIKPAHIMAWMASSESYVGIRLLISDEDYKTDAVPPVCKALRVFFASSDIPVTPFHVQGFQAGRCQLTIGYKPSE